MKNLDMDALRTLVKGVELGTFAKAAVAVARSQFAVSGQLRKLEAQVGETLFRRSGRSLVMTPAGEQLVAFARRILDINDEALDSIQTSRLDGAVRLGIPADFAEKWLPGVLGRFARSHPRVQIEVHADRSSKLTERVAAGRLDLALVWDTALDGTHAETVASIRAGWIVSARSPSNPPLEGPLPIVAFDEPCVFRRIGLAALAAHGVAWRIAFVSPSLPGLWAAVDAGLGVAMRTSIALPPTVAFLDSSAGGLPPLPSVSLVLYKTCKHLSTAAETLASLVAETVRSSQATGWQPEN
jgi:DNA-binding transcriptional LysR family regulator